MAAMLTREPSPGGPYQEHFAASRDQAVRGGDEPHLALLPRTVVPAAKVSVRRSGGDWFTSSSISGLVGDVPLTGGEWLRLCGVWGPLYQTRGGMNASGASATEQGVREGFARPTLKTFDKHGISSKSGEGPCAA